MPPGKKPRDHSPRPLEGEGGESVRPSAANGLERSEGAQGELASREGVQPAIFEMGQFAVER